MNYRNASRFVELNLGQFKSVVRGKYLEWDGCRKHSHPHVFLAWGKTHTFPCVSGMGGKVCMRGLPSMPLLFFSINSFFLISEKGEILFMTEFAGEENIESM